MEGWRCKLFPINDNGMDLGLVEVYSVLRQNLEAIVIQKYALDLLLFVFEIRTNNQQADYDEHGPSIVRRFALLGGPGST